MSFKSKLLSSLMVSAMALSGAMTALAADIAVIGGSNEDAFWNIIKKGIDDARPAVEANGGSVNYLRVPNYDNFGPDLVNLIRTATSQQVDGLVVPVWLPDAQNPAIKDAIAAGVKIMLINAGQSQAEELDALNYFGSDEFQAGVAGGEYFANHGARKVICVNHVPGAINLEARCNGVQEGAASGGTTSEQLPLPANLDGNIPAVTEAIKATLLQDPDIDGVITLAAWASNAASLAVQQAGKSGDVIIGTFDMDAAVLDRIKNGTQTFSIDQQPYLQGFLGVSMLAAHIDFGTELATDPVLTGPAIVDASNVDSALTGVSLGAR